MTIIAIPPLAQALPEMRDGLNLLVVGTVFASFLIPAASGASLALGAGVCSLHMSGAAACFAIPPR